MRRAWGSNKRAIIDHLVDNPGDGAVEISAATGIPVKTIYPIMSRMKDAEHQGYFALSVRSQAATFIWLRRTCPEGVSLSDHIVSILVDAMNEESR